MIIKSTNFDNLIIIKCKKHEDKRGFFMESFNKELFNKLIKFDFNFCQNNIVKSNKNVLRGLHFQKKPYEQSKLLYVISGRIIDVVVDIRKNSKTYGKYFKIELSSKNNLMILIPKGFAHGYLSLEDNTIVNYFVDEFYNKNYEHGIRYDSSEVNIDWGIDNQKLILSKKDKNLNFSID